MDDIVEFRNGDASCHYFVDRDIYSLYVTKCGEMFHFEYNTFDEIENILRDNFDFDDELVEELKSKITFDGDIKSDIKTLIRVFDNFVDNMYDRGQFDPDDGSDKEINILLKRLIKKYLV